MLVSLYIENYALIKKMEIRFQPGLTVITGETGAGKSIVLGALGLILGQRADSTVLQDTNSKCIVEGCFNLKSEEHLPFFEEHDLDFEETTLIRREITVSGKSRAFINDTPVNLNVIKDLGDRLIDIHSQHETLYLRDPFFQLEVLDQYAGHTLLLEEYAKHYYAWKKSTEQLALLREKERQSKLDQDYYQYLFNELDAAAFSANEQEELEEELAVLSHAGDIKSGILTILDILDKSEQSLISRISEVQHLFNSIASFHPQLKEMNDRMSAISIETRDISRELDHLSDHIQVDPQRQEWVQSRLDTLYTLQKKHGVNTIQELTMIREDFEKKLLAVTSIEEEIKQLSLSEKEEFQQLDQLGGKLHEGRKKAIHQVRKEILVILSQLGMPNASFEVAMHHLSSPCENGKDQVNFLFSANKGSAPADISKVASGGELSRLMLAVKSMVSRQKLLPTLIFDEIDLGISGEIASKVGQILQKLSDEKQLIVITHLPQIAGRGQYHYYIYKMDGEKDTTTHLKVLNEEERVEEIARMISGDSYSGSTLETARELLENHNSN